MFTMKVKNFLSQQTLAHIFGQHQQYLHVIVQFFTTIQQETIGTKIANISTYLTKGEDRCEHYKRYSA